MKQVSNFFASTLLSIAFLTACGGSGGGSPPAPDPDPAPETAVISGTAIKGIIKFGIVKIYGVTNGVKDATPLIEGTTDANGDYSLTVEDYSGPVVIEITADANSMMKCDVLAGCEGTAFGLDIPLTSNFSLKALVPSVSANQTISTNVSALTTLAAALAEDSGSISETSVNQANSQVASLFNITGKLTQIAAVDITDVDKVASASNDALGAAILNAALLSAALADATEGSTVSDVLQTISLNFVANGGQITQNESTNSSAVSLSEIYSSALAFISSPTLSNMALGSFESTTKLLKSRADNATPDSLTVAAPGDPANEDSAQAAKDMVGAVRAFGLASTYTGSGEATFLNSLDIAADLVSSDDIVTVLAGIAEVSAALEAAYIANMEAIDAGLAPLSAFSYGDESEFAIPVTITTGSDSFTYSIVLTVPADVTQSVAIDIDIAAVLALDASETVNVTETSETGSFAGSVGFDLSGSISSTNIAMTINSGTIAGDLTSNWTYDESSEPYTEDEQQTDTLDLVDIDFNITLAQLTGTMPISFTGALALEITDVTAAYSYNFSQCDANDGPVGTTFCTGSEESEAEEQTFDKLDFMLSGLFSKDAESVKASVTLLIDPDPSVHSYYSSWYSNWINYFVDDLSTDAYANTYESGLLGETEENFVGVQFGIALDFDLSANSAITGLMFAASRTGLTAGEASLDIKVGANRLDIDVVVDSDDAELTVTDQNGNTLTISETCIEDVCTFSGIVMINGEQVATLTQDEDNDVTVITYADGSFEVL